MKELDKISVDLILKLITISAFLLLIMNFIFNLGYFSCMGIRYASLLEIKDYYEGTAPSLIFVLAIFLTLANALLFSNFIKNIIIVINMYLSLLGLNCNFKILVMFKYKKIPYKLQKKITMIKKKFKFDK